MKVPRDLIKINGIARDQNLLRPALLGGRTTETRKKGGASQIQEV